jgi:hypothetical protein
MSLIEFSYFTYEILYSVEICVMKYFLSFFTKIILLNILRELMSLDHVTQTIET